MGNPWDGAERRKDVPGRRSSDRGVCSVHSVIAHECEKEKVEMWKKIDALFVSLGSLVTWKVFALLVTLSVTIIGSGFLFFGSQIKETNQLIIKMNDQVSGLNQTIGVVLWRMESVEKKVDRIESENGK